MLQAPKPFRKIPQSAYDRMKHWLFKHPALHYFVHQIYCRFAGKYSKCDWSEWISNHQHYFFYQGCMKMLISSDVYLMDPASF